MKLTSWFRYRAEDYGRPLSLFKKADLFVRRKLARPTRWDRAVEDWCAAHPGVAARLEAITKTLVNRALITAPAPCIGADPPTGLRIGVACHLFYDDLAAGIAARLEAIPVPFRLVITTDTEAKRDRIQAAVQGLTQATTEVRIVPNRGRDIAPKLVGCADLHAECDIVLHIHGKKSVHVSGREDWRDHILDRLLGDRASVATILHVFETCPDVGMIAPATYNPGRTVKLGRSAVYFAVLAEALGRPIDPLTDWPDHPNGSMFWARSAALAPLTGLKLDYRDFGDELRQYSATLAHGVEYAYFYAADLAGFKALRVARDGDQDAPPPAPTLQALAAQIETAKASAPSA